MDTEKSTSTMTPLASTNGRKAIRKAKKFSDSSSSPSRRKSLQLLQPVAGDQSQLVGSDGVIRLTNQTSKTPKRKLASDGKSQPKKVFRSDGGKNFTIFEDSSNSSSSSQTLSAEQEAIDMMTQAEPTPKYWEELAEERRVALEETLKENEQLFVENCELKKENDKLKVMANQAEYLADVVETLVARMDSSLQKAAEIKDIVNGIDTDHDEDSDHDDEEEDDGDEEEDDDEEEDEVFDHDEDPVHEDEPKDDKIDGEESTISEGKEDEV